MHTSRAICGTAIFCVIVAGGCHSQSNQQSGTRDTSPYVRRDQPGVLPQSAPQPVAPSSPEQPAAPTPGTAQALAQRAQSYANLIAPKNAASPNGAPDARPSWPDPEALHLTPQPDPVLSAPAAQSAGSGETRVAKNGQANASVAVPVSQHLITPEPPRPAPAAHAVDGDSLARKFAARAKDYPADLSAQVDYQVLKFLTDEPVPDISSLAGLAPEDRELLSATMDSLTNFRNQLRQDNNMLFSKKIRPLVELGDRLRSQAELSVPTVALCTGVKAFGVYEPIDPARFIAGKDNRVVVYCEVENFLSQPGEKGLYETRLAQDIVLYTEASGLPVWTEKRSSYVDQSRRRRRDFFMGKIITLPANLSIGRYLLKVTVEDQQARHIAENTVPVEIVAQ
ncbi:MAG TPA: hypothetical protein VLJ39_05175 [Tepidisphaeraceae bacterium]|nr:hypothetical protein [Tepidisphaeraceae bacterium]